MGKRTERFPGQKEGEIVKLVVTKHWVVYLRIFRALMVFAMAPFLGILFMTSDTPMETRIFVYMFMMIYLSYFFLVIFIRWLDDMLDLLIVTNQRLISIEQVNLFHNTSSETNLTMIQDVQARKKGVLGNLLQYGQLEIQTAAEKITFVMEDVPDLFTISKRILDLRDEVVRRQELQKHDGGTNYGGPHGRFVTRNPHHDLPH